MRNVINAQKDDVFRIRMNSEIKNELEEVFAKNGLTLTDAVNVFFQQALNTGGFPFSVTEDNAENMKAKALTKLIKELEIGMNCTESYSEEEAKKIGTVDFLVQYHYTDCQEIKNNQIMEAVQKRNSFRNLLRKV